MEARIIAMETDPMGERRDWGKVTILVEVKDITRWIELWAKKDMIKVDVNLSTEEADAE